MLELLMDQKRGGGKSKKKTDLSNVSKVLQTLLANGKSPLSDQFLRWKLWRAWPTVVGETLGKICEPVGYDRGRLFIWVKSSARMQEIRFFENTLKEKVNGHLGRAWARSIRFTLDRHGIPKEAEAPAELLNYLSRDHTPEAEAEPERETRTSPNEDRTNHYARNPGRPSRWNPK